MAIYNNPNTSIVENASYTNEEILVEGMTKAYNPPKEFYNIIERIVDEFDDKVKGMGVNKGIFSKDKKFGDEKSYKNSLDKAKEDISKAERVNGNSIKVNLNLVYLELKTNGAPNELCEKIARIINKEGFALNPKSKNILKKLFVKRVCYKELDDEHIMILRWRLGWVNVYGIPQNFTNLDITCSAVKNDEKTLKHLNMLEESFRFEDECGIFDECLFI